MKTINKHMRGLAPLLAAVSLLLFAAACQTIGTPQKAALIEWRTLKNGSREAREKGMPVLIDFFYGATCMRCEYFEHTLYTDPEIAAAVNKNFIPVRVHLSRARTEAEGALLMKLSPTQECVLAFLDKNGEIITDEKDQPISSMEMLNKEQLLAYMTKALERLR